MQAQTRLIMRTDAIFDSAFGVVLFLSPWLHPLFDLLELPNPEPELFTQFAGGLLVVCGYLLWVSTNDESLAPHVALSIGAVNAAGVVLIIGWLLIGMPGTATIGTLLLLIVCVILTIFAVAELRYAIPALREHQYHQENIK